MLPGAGLGPSFAAQPFAGKPLDIAIQTSARDVQGRLQLAHSASQVHRPLSESMLRGVVVETFEVLAETGKVSLDPVPRGDCVFLLVPGVLEAVGKPPEIAPFDLHMGLVKSLLQPADVVSKEPVHALEEVDGTEDRTDVSAPTVLAGFSDSLFDHAVAVGIVE